MSADDRHSCQFAIQGGPLDDPVALVDHAREVEALGYRELFTADHLGSPDPFAPLMIAASATKRLRLGTLVLNNEFYNPALLARTAATVDRLCGGRFILGMGAGYAAAEHESIGQPIRPPGPRVSRFGESLAVLRSLLDTGKVDHEGRFETVKVEDLGLAPAQERLPLLIGGHGPRMVSLAGRYGDVYQFTGLGHGPDGAIAVCGFGLGDLVERSRWLSEAAGERDHAIERSALVQFTAVGDEVPSSADLAERFGVEPKVIEETPFVLSGSVDQIVDKIGRLRDLLGITHYVVRDARGFAPIVEAIGR